LVHERDRQQHLVDVPIGLRHAPRLPVQGRRRAPSACTRSAGPQSHPRVIAVASQLRGRQRVPGVVLRPWLPRPHPYRRARPPRRSG
jgi:hypothetical protein